MCLLSFHGAFSLFSTLRSVDVVGFGGVVGKGILKVHLLATVAAVNQEGTTGKVGAAVGAGGAGADK